MQRTPIGRWIALLLSVFMVVSLVGCDSSGSSDSTETPPADTDTDTPATDGGDDATPEPVGDVSGAQIEIATRTESRSNTALKELIAAFEAESGVNVVLTEYSSDDYEGAMKTRMASNELPDVFETHGWSRLRYGEYLTPLNNEPWYDDMTELARGILEGPGDVGYALMVSCAALGVAANVTVASENGVDIYAIETLDDYVEACRTLIDAGIVPMVNHSSGGDLTHVAGIFTSYPDALSVDGEAQLNGTWDWESFMPELEWFAELLEMGAFWDDRSTMDTTMDVERVATGKSVFYFGNGIDYCEQLNDLNPDYEYAVIPFPAAKEGAKRYAAGGEGYTVGFWNETSEPDACRTYLSYLAENGYKMIEASGGLPAFTTYEVAETYGLGITNNLFDRYPDCVYENMWDREYMPSGMWPVFGEAVGMLYADHSQSNLESINAFLKSNYDEKYAAAQEG